MAISAEDILSGFDEENLRAWSVDGRWGTFRMMLRDIEMVDAARVYLPEGHPAKEGLQGNIDRCIDKLVSSYYGHIGNMICCDQLRLFRLFRLFREVPQAKERIKGLLDQEVKKDVGEPIAAPGCQHPQAHRSLLKIWNTLDTEDYENMVVEDAIADAFLSHNRESRQPPQRSQDHTQASVSVFSNREEAERLGRLGKLPVEFVPVQWIFIDRKIYKQVSVKFIKNEEKAVLEIHVKQMRVEIPDFRFDVDLNLTYTIHHSPPKKDITMFLASNATRKVFLANLRTTKLGELFLQKLEMLSTPDGTVE